MSSVDDAVKQRVKTKRKLKHDMGGRMLRNFPISNRTEEVQYRKSIKVTRVKERKKTMSKKRALGPSQNGQQIVSSLSL